MCCGIQGVLPSLIWFMLPQWDRCGIMRFVLSLECQLLMLKQGFYKWSRLVDRSILGPTLNFCNHCIEIAFVWGSTPERHNQSWCAVLGTAGPKAQGQCLRASTQNPGQREWWLNWSCWFRINDCHPQYWKIIRFFKIQPAKVQYLGWLNWTRSDSSWNHQMLKSQPTEWWSYLKYLEIFGISYANWRRVQYVSHTNWMQSLVWLSCWTATPRGTSWLVCNQSNLAAVDSLMDDRFRELADL